MSYHLAGIISSVIFSLTLWGIFTQLRLIWLRKAGEGYAGGCPSAVLSVNQFLSSFLAFFAFYIYGISLERFNHYLVWTRFPACLLTLAVLFEIANDRRQLLSVLAFLFSSIALLLATFVLFGFPELRESVRWGSSTMILVVTVILAQGYLHQVVLIRRSGSTGAISIRYHQLLLAKDLATAVFSVTMGLKDGWPILILCTVSGMTKTITLWHFRLVRKSALPSQQVAGHI